MRIAGIRVGRRRAAALVLAAAAVALAAVVAGLFGGRVGEIVLAGLGAGLAVALGVVGIALRRLQAAVTPRLAAHEEQLASSRAAIEAANRSAEGRERAVWEYATGALRDEPDTFVLYRIIGNDLPPRHRAGQTLENLRFILEYEPELPSCQKRWVVNRIVDPAVEKRILALLEEYGAGYLRIPFDVDEYRRVPWRFDGFPVPGFTYRPEFEKLTPLHRQWALDHVYHWKNLYVMNNNGARNTALREGRARAKWVLPWDGNCFLTRQAWDELVAAVTARPYLKYFTVPMARVLDNTALLRPDPDVEPVEEPQLAFRRDAREEFDENARYGRCPKVELFWRLGVVGAWDRWCRGPWDPVRAGLSVEAGQFGRAGWVARLSSGERQLERDAEGRAVRRSEAIRARIDGIDEELATGTFEAAAPFTVDRAVLEHQRERWRAGDPGPVAVVDRLVARARGGTAEVADAAIVLALAGHLTGERQFLAAGAERLRTGLPRPDRGFLPGLYYLLDAARLLAAERALPATDAGRLREWVAAHRAWLRDSVPGRTARSALDHRGTWFDVDAIAASSYLDDLPDVLAVLRRAHERREQQGPPADPYHLQGWLVLARFAGRAGQDLWSGERGVLAAVRRSAGGDDAGQRAAIVHQTPGVPELVERLAPGDRDPYQVRQVFGPRDGIRPFWALGRAG